jgi:hypothetical protein
MNLQVTVTLETAVETFCQVAELQGAPQYSENRGAADPVR